MATFSRDETANTVQSYLDIAAPSLLAAHKALMSAMGALGGIEDPDFIGIGIGIREIWLRVDEASKGLSNLKTERMFGEPRPR